VPVGAWLAVGEIGAAAQPAATTMVAMAKAPSVFRLFCI
jgi:hypothetical protein